MNARWPAIVFQGIFLAANVSFLLDGKPDRFILASVTVIALLFVFQTISRNPRFMYLFPVSQDTGIQIPSVDTLVLKALVVLAVLLFYVGATGSYIWAGALVAIGIASPLVWLKWIQKHNDRIIQSKVREHIESLDQEESEVI